MRRRTVLATVGTTCVASAGCLAGLESADPGTDEPTEPATDEFAVAVERPAHVLTMREQHPEEGPTNADPVAELNEATRTAVADAVDGTYETDDPSDELLDGLHRLPYVEYEGVVYELSRTMPEHVVEGAEVDESDADPDATIGMMDDRIRTVGVDNREISRAVNTIVRMRQGPTGRVYRATVLDDELADFLDTYDYVAYPDDGDDGPEPEGYVRLSRSFDDPGPPYELRAEPLADADRYGAPVVDVATFPANVAGALQAAADRRSYRTDDPPDGLRDAVEREGYVRVDGRVHEPELRDVDHDALPVTVDATLDGDGAFELAVENVSDGTVELFGGAPAPFGVLGAWSADGERATLWSDAYEESDHVHVDEERGELVVNDIGLGTELKAGESLAERYEVHPEWGFEAGRYRAESSLSVRWGDRDEDESGNYPFSLVLRVPALGD